LVQKVIRDALPEMEELHRVYLTGGSSYIPALQAKLGELLPLKLGLLGDPKQVTSTGALQAPIPLKQEWVGGQTPAPVANGLETAADTADVTGVPLTKSAMSENQRIPVQASATTASEPQGLAGRTWKMLIAGGAVIAATILGSAVMLSNTGTGPRPETAAPSARTCGGVPQGALSASECDLLNRQHSRTSLVAAESCTSNPDPQEAGSAIVCDPAADSGFSPALQAKIYLYGYDSAEALASSFETDVNNSGAGKGSVTEPPAWEIWTYGGTTANQGRILSFTAGDSRVLVWTDDKALMKIRAESNATVDELYNWWQDKWTPPST
jgi:hypothetical protein